MATINVTLRLVKKYFESNPVWTTWEQMQVSKVEFHITDLSGERLIKVDVPLTDKNSSEFISTSVTLAQNTDYLVHAIAFSPFHPTGVLSEKVEFNTGDGVTYYNFETTVIDKFSQTALSGAVLTFDAAGLNIEKTSRHDGLVWIQRIAAGTYTVTVEKTGYDTVNTTWVAGLTKIPYIQLSPTPSP